MVGSFQPIALPMTNAQLYGHNNNNNNTASTTQNTLNTGSGTNNQLSLDPAKVSQLSSAEQMQLRQLLEKTGVSSTPRATTQFNTSPFGATQQVDPIGKVQGMGMNIQPTNVGGGTPYMSQEMAGVSISILVAGLSPNPQTGLPASTPEQVEKLVKNMLKNATIVRHPSWPQALQLVMMYIQQGNAMAMQNQGLTQQFTQATAQNGGAIVYKLSKIVSRN